MSDRPPRRRVVVFLGPTLSVGEARTVLPEADYRPPVAQGDIFSMLGDGAPVAIGIVDGVFYQDLPVWHKEILHALAAGVAVYGASSMGALRAAECAPFGMVGIGAIFEAYATGRLVDDDEVALSHGGPESGWCPYTEPMVNLRATMEAAVRDARIHPALSARFLTSAKKVWFPERTRQRLFERADGWAEGEQDVAAVRSALESAYLDQKRVDALLLLETLRALRDGAADASTGDGIAHRIEVSRSHVFDAFIERDRKVVRANTSLRLEEIARHVALHDPDYPRLRDRALDRILVDMLAVARGVDPTPDQVAQELGRIRARLRLSDDAAEAAWLADNHVDDAWLKGQAEREARARILREWLRIRQGKRLTVRPVLDEVRLENRYGAASEAAALHHKLRGAPADSAPWWSGGGENGTGPSDLGQVAADLIGDQLRFGGWRPDVPVATFADEAGFSGVAELLEELAAARSARERARAHLASLEAIFGGDG
jgi:hypothetical protein